MEDSVMETSTEEQDLLNRSINKPKEFAGTEPSAWAGRSGVDVIQGRYADTSIYTGEDEEDTEIADVADAVENIFGDEHGEDGLIIPVDECLELWRPWRRALIIKLLGKGISYSYLSQRLSNLWRCEGRIELTDLDNGYYIVRFTRRDDYEVALENGPWVIQGHYLAVTKWKPFFEPVDGAIKTTLAWVRFRRFPIWASREQFLMKLGNMVGKAIKAEIEKIYEIAILFKKKYEIAISGSDDEKISAATILCVSSLIRGWNIHVFRSLFWGIGIYVACT